MTVKTIGAGMLKTSDDVKEFYLNRELNGFKIVSLTIDNVHKLSFCTIIFKKKNCSELYKFTDMKSHYFENIDVISRMLKKGA